jgi:hypothetical protein
LKSNGFFSKKSIIDIYGTVLPRKKLLKISGAATMEL